MADAINEERAYWKNRTDKLLEQLEKDEAKLYEKLDRIYGAEAAKLERDIAAYYQKYGVDDVIEYRRLLEAASQEDLKMLIESIDSFVRKYPQYAYLMPVNSTIYKLNELEAIQQSIRVQQLAIGAIEQAEIESHLTKYARDAANLAAEQDGYGGAFYDYNSEVVKLTVNSSWAYGGNFSERIWGNRESLAAYLNNDFAKLIARGVSYDECVTQLRKYYENTSRKNVKRLVFTEGTFVFNEAQARVHEGLFDYYTLSTAQDRKVCNICAGMERQSTANPIRFDERAAGVNFPPLHPWCRCSYIVAVEDWDKWIDDYVARNGGDELAPEVLNLAHGYHETDVSESTGNDSLAKWTRNGSLADEREALHRRIINSYLRKSSPIEGQRVFTVMGGGPAAGKSTILRSGKVELPNGSVVVDSDAIKAMLPEYNSMVAAGDRDAARYVHEESSALAKRIMRILGENGYSYTLDGTGDGSVSGLLKKISQARALGMRVEGIYATVPTDEAVSRSMKRAESTGREVPEDLIRETHAKVSRILAEVAEEFDSVLLYDTSEDVTLIARGGGGSGLVAEEGKEKALGDFIAKGGG